MVSTSKPTFSARVSAHSYVRSYHFLSNTNNNQLRSYLIAEVPGPERQVFTSYCFVTGPLKLLDRVSELSCYASCLSCALTASARDT